MNEGQTLNFYKHFIYKEFVVNFKTSGFAGFTGWICNLDIRRYLRHKLEKIEILDSSRELSFIRTRANK